MLAALGLAAVLMAAAAAAIQPALWALGFAFARWRRVALLAYWVGLLVAALPLMDWVSRRRKVPTIIVRKVRSTIPAMPVLPLTCQTSLSSSRSLLICNRKRRNLKSRQNRDYSDSVQSHWHSKPSAFWLQILSILSDDFKGLQSLPLPLSHLCWVKA